MKLQKQSSRKRDDPNYEKYVKWVLVIPTDRINQLGWKEGQEVKDEIKGNNLIVSPVSEKNNLENKEEVILLLDKLDKIGEKQVIEDELKLTSAPR